MARIVHIDGDILIYAIGFATGEDPLAFALHSVKMKVNHIVEMTGADQLVMYISGRENFRDEVATIQPYKGNRKDVTKPYHYQAIKDYIITKYSAVVSDGEEADDLLGIACTVKDEHTHILASIDKDLNMIEGNHFNWNKIGNYTVSREEGDKFFIEQLLTGDATDNIPGLKRTTGKIASKKTKEYCLEGEDFGKMVDRVIEIYQGALEGCTNLTKEEAYEGAVDIINEIGQLLWIRRTGFHSFIDYLAEGDWKHGTEEEVSR